MIISLFVAGCSSTTGGINAQALIQANAQVQTLLEEYPDANLDITYYSVNESSQLEEEYSSICSKEFSQKALYRFSLQDDSQGLNVIGYLNPNEQVVECVSREGSENNTNSNAQNNENSTSSGDTSMIVNSTAQEVNLYYDVEAKYKGIEPTQEQRELLEDLRDLTNNHDLAFKLEFEIEYENGETDRKEEGIVDSQEILDIWNKLLSQITTQVENSSAQEIEVNIEIAKKRVEEGYDGENSFEIKVESNDEKDDKENESQEIEIEVEINKNTQTSRAEIEINDREEVMEFDTTSLEEIKQKIANEFNVEYGVVASNTEVEYEYNDDKEEKEERSEKDEDIEVEISINKNTQTSRAEIEYNNEVFNMEFNTISVEEIKTKISSEFDVEYLTVASNTKIEYETSKEDNNSINNEEIQANIIDLNLSPSAGIESGKEAILKIKVKNLNDNQIEKIQIEVDIPELNINSKSYLYEIERLEEVESQDIYLDTNKELEAGEYEGEVEISNYYSGNTLDKKLFNFRIINSTEE